ncbi:hypothetical protein PFICI_03204 [Pestalotiopsis fici W106-1]|uniref:Uncharacterized protein n=1 Tax=Pestalotiopsis fici (strain W106-1 / CGMCC3.15140) TaxID=1229662 RepID=W3XGP0_PESFW|nr:uncharacterized protein PFICI_03204 [Pestalotiopsis fici W106-1]ETS85179.1 hypothetical protein PFICI_03204 [Pestalotiopsis fici W106-1]
MASHDPIAVRKSIRRLRSTGRFSEADQLIANLPGEVKISSNVAIEIAQLYLVQGHWRLAAQTCEVAFESRWDEYDAVNVLHHDRAVEVAAFKMLSAFIGIGRYSKLKTALEIARRVGNTWNFHDPSLPPYEPTSLGDTEGQCELPLIAQISLSDTVDSSATTSHSVPENTDTIAHYEVSLPSFTSAPSVLLYTDWR